MRVRIEKSTAQGEICAPPSKSMAHRLLLSAALAEGVSTIRGISFCEDVFATIDCLKSLGIKTEISENDITVYGKSHKEIQPESTLLCRESGSTLRFMIPIALLSDKLVSFSGAKSLMQRPMDIYREISYEKGYAYIDDGEKIVVKGPLKNGEYKLRGNVSSQFISGLLFALPLLDGDSIIRITSSVESRSYINLTISALERFGVKISWLDDYSLEIRGRQKYLPQDITVEGDYSGAAFPDALNLFGGNVKITGLDENSIQGDKIYKKHFTSIDRGVPTIHIGDCPDLGPIIFAVSAAKNGGIFDGTRRLKIKESDRGAAMAAELKKFGVCVSVYDDTIVVFPKEFHAPCEILNGHNDHRIVMSLSILLTLVGGEIDGAEAIKKSYPAFFDDLRKLGIEVTEYEN